jgi:heme/copper-type cytochrome/quinol oxidase subunit 2
MIIKHLTNLMSKTAAIIIAAAIPAAACPMCKASIANADNAAEVLKTINAAILVLLIPVLVIIGGFVRLVFKYRNYQNEDSSVATARSNDSYVNLRTSESKRDTQ